MVTLSLHGSPRVRSWRALLHMLAAYRLPLLIFISATALIWGYNAFFCRLLGAVREGEATGVLPLEAKRLLQEQRYVLGYTATRTFAVFALTLGNALAALMYWSLARVIFTCPGYVPAEPWRCVPRFDTERRQHLKVTWSAQLKWIQEQGLASRQRAVQALQEQQFLWEYPLDMLRGQPMHACPSQVSGFKMAPGFVFYPAMPLGRFPASNGVSSSDSLLMAAPSPQPAFSPLHLTAAESQSVLCTPPLTADVPHLMAMENASASPARAAVSCSGATVPPQALLTPCDALSSNLSHSSTETTTTSTAASYSCGSSPSSTSRPTTPVTSTLGRGATGVRGFDGFQASCDAAAPGCCIHRRPCTPITAAKSTMNPHLVLEYEADGSLRFCGVCHQYKPDGSHHCRICQRCVFDMDHHCCYLGNCIGRHNYKYFFLCISYATWGGAVNSMLFVIAYGCSAVCRNWGHGWWWVPAGMCAVSVCVAYLWAQHAFLLMRGASTLERIAERSSEHFLRSVSQPSHGQAIRPENCSSDCRMAIKDCARLIEAKRKHFDVLERSNMSCRLHKNTTASFTNSGRGDGEEGAPPTPSNRARRRAQRFVLLFGRPRFSLYHLLPLSPPGESSRPRGQAWEEV
ncbi:hypothetical protein, unknown function [Leishmania tarentolae]|uniref:Palmitoyltransferase n=1 Tax=Leishmania tarentolae TaxID=5689 RepID=A0A640KMA8_LEITA|nr:hypothetical protein, unknown function [Leishmania tarentolae]